MGASYIPDVRDVSDLSTSSEGTKPIMLASSVQAVVASCSATVPRVCTLVLFIKIQ